MQLKKTRRWVASLVAAGALVVGTAACDDGGGGGDDEEDTTTEDTVVEDTVEDTTENDTVEPDVPEDTAEDTAVDTITEPTETCPPAGYEFLDCEDVSGTCVCVLTGQYVDDFTLRPIDNVAWLLRGGVFIGDDESETTLTIEPGTTIYGESAATPGMLVIRRHSKIMAEGTADDPIVLTSANLPGDRARGDWGGVIINGIAPLNGCETPPCEAYGEGGTGWYGAPEGESADPNDDSGVVQYVRIEFAGHIISPENELNGLALQGVGDGTTLDHIQIHMNKDDGIEFFGGTVNFKYVYTTGTADDNLDWTDGWVGKGQFFVAQQYDDNGDQGIEADNNGEDNDATPRSHPTISNITLIGSPENEKSDLGILLREGTAANISCAVVAGFNDACFDVDHDATYTNAWDSGAGDLSDDLTLTDSLLQCVTLYSPNDDDDPGSPPFTLQEFVETHNSGNTAGTSADATAVVTDTEAFLTDPFNTDTPDFTPVSGAGADAGCTTPSDAFFESVTFKGGVDPADDWTTGWTTNAAD
jgi:hypothetical protein